MSEITVLKTQQGNTQDPNTPSRVEMDGAQRLERRLLIALSGGVLLAVSWIGDLLGSHDLISHIPAAIGSIILVIPLLSGAWKEIKQGQPSSDSLASLAVVAALAAGMYLAAGFLALFLWMANLILSRTAWGAQRAIKDLVDLTPGQARLIENSKERMVPLKEVVIGMIIRVRPGENFPADGIIVAGNSDINQASLTGEAVPIEAQSGTEVYAGTTNITGQTKTARQNRAAWKLSSKLRLTCKPAGACRPAARPGALRNHRRCSADRRALRGCGSHGHNLDRRWRRS